MHEAHWNQIGSHLRTPALKNENFSNKSVVLVKRGNGFAKTLFSEGGLPHTDGTFTGTLVNVRDLCRNAGECQGGPRQCGLWVRQSSSGFAKVRMKARTCCWYTLEPA